MPTIASFYGITIYMYWADHAPPHLHAIYSGEEAKFAILTGELIEGDVSRRTSLIVREWIALRREALMENWQRGQDLVPFERIAGPTDADVDQNS